MATTVQTGVAPNGTVANMQSVWSDPMSKQAILLGATSLVNDLFKSKSPEWRQATILAVVDYIALRWINGFFAGSLAGVTGEQMWSGYLSEGISLSLALMAGKQFGILGRGSAQGLIDSPEVGSGPVANYTEDVVTTAMLLIERQVLTFAAQKTGLIA